MGTSTTSPLCRSADKDCKFLLLRLVPTLVCRFILNLRQAGTDNLLDQQSRSASLVGNLGQSLQFRSVHDEEDEENGENTGTTRDTLESNDTGTVTEV